MLHVCPVDVLVPREPRQVRGLELRRERREADDVEVVLRKRRSDQRVEREGHLLRGEEAAAEQHRAGDVDEDRGRRLRRELRAVDVEILCGELHRDLRAVADDRVAYGARKIEEEGVAELIGLELVGWIAATPSRLRAVRPERVLLQRLEDLLERALADLADPPRRELVAVPVLSDEAGLLEELGHPAQLVEGLPRRRPGEPLDLIAIERREVFGVAR